MPSVLTIDAINLSLNQKQAWIPCELTIKDVDEFTVNHWLERLYLERLEGKYKAIETQLLESKHNWEAVVSSFCFTLEGDLQVKPAFS